MSGNENGTSLRPKKLASKTISNSKSEMEMEVKKQVIERTNILLLMKTAIVKVGEPMELVFSIYNNTNGQNNGFLSENFVVQLNQSGMPDDHEYINNMYTLFLDLSEQEIGNSDLYLVCNIIRKGKMNLEKGKPSKTPFRRPFAGAVLKLTKDLLQDKPKDAVMDLYCFSDKNMSSFFDIHKAIIENRTEIQKVPLSQGVHVSTSIIKGYYSELKNEEIWNTIKNYPETLRWGFPENMIPGETRNELFVELNSAQLSSEKSLEIHMQVLLEDGTVVDNCITHYVDKNKSKKAEYVSWVTHKVGNNPKWGERIRINIDAKQCSKMYLYLTILECKSGKTAEYAHAFLKLTKTDGTVLNDGKHLVDLFKPTKNATKASMMNPSSKIQIKKEEKIQINIKLCSTGLTQNISMLQLLHWKEYPNRVKEILSRFTYVDAFEIIKFLEETFNSLFQILEAQEDLSEMVFEALTKIVGLLTDSRSSKFTKFEPLLDNYINTQYKNKNAHIILGKCLVNCLKEGSGTKNVLASLKSLNYIFKFMSRSKKLFEESSSGNNKQDLQEGLSLFFLSLNSLLSKDDPNNLLAIQGTIFKIFPLWFEQLEIIFGIDKLTQITCQLLNSLPFHDTSTKSHVLVTDKLKLMDTLLSSILLDSEGSRQLFITTLVENFQKYFEKGEENQVDLILNLITDILHSFQTKNYNIPTSILSLLPYLSSSFSLPTTSPQKKELIVTILLGMLFLVGYENINTYIQYSLLPLRSHLPFLSSLLHLLLSVIQSPIYDSTWWALLMFQFDTIGQFLQLGNYFPSYCSPNNPKEMTLSKDYLALCLNFISTDVLALESFSSTKRALVLNNFGDLRIKVIDPLTKLFGFLAESQPEIMETLIPNFFNLIFVEQKEIQGLGVSLYVTCLKQEYKRTGGVSNGSANTAKALDNLFMSENSHPNSLLANFTLIFQRNLESQLSSSDDLKHVSQHLLSFVSDYLSFHLSLKTLAPTPTYNVDRANAVLGIMNYCLSKKGNIETFEKLAFFLAEQHKKEEMFVEAANCYLRVSNLLSWTNDYDRKCDLMNEAIDLFAEGKYFEKSIELLQILRDKHESYSFNYIARAEVLKKMSKFYRSMTQSRLAFFPMYYRVGYYGKGFGKLANKEFIFKAKPLQRLDEFREPFEKKYPSAQFLSYTNPPDSSITDSDEMYFQIFQVQPSSREEMKKEERKLDKKWPSEVLKFQTCFDLDVFVYSKPVKKSKTGEEVLDIWINKIFYVTSEKLPSEKSNTEIIEKSEVDLSPIEFALEQMQEKNLQVQERIDTYSEDGRPTDSQPFIQTVQGVLDAAVNGGVVKYKNAFLISSYLEQNPSHKIYVDGLAKMIKEQLHLCKKSLDLWPKVCTEQFAPLLKLMQTRFDQMQELISSL
eukprot:TRINITY_DN4896_c0_g1_i1.p1 TRINITY_DN4896_c0_g1~~TRINITY_DN4896_c0_g1_i1.p1  ORF type:complete len:1575 (-),score=457.60 TRINITY_DN4896_c0_g1_i1:11-4198(-)